MSLENTVRGGASHRRIAFEFWAGAVLLGGIASLSLLAPGIAPADPLALDMLNAAEPPRGAWLGLLGTDDLGRDLLSRVLHGGRIVLLLAAMGAILGTALGVSLALLAVGAGGPADQFLSRAADSMLAVPNLILAIILVAFVGYSFEVTLLVLVLATWVLPFRINRALLRSTLALPYIEASRMSGLSAWQTARHHLLPVILPQMAVILSINFTIGMMLVSSLSYLGLGVQPPTPDWGQMVAASQGQIGFAWWAPVFPGLAIVLAAIGAQLLGDAVAKRFSLSTRLGTPDD